MKCVDEQKRAMKEKNKRKKENKGEQHGKRLRDLQTTEAKDGAVELLKRTKVGSELDDENHHAPAGDEENHYALEEGEQGDLSVSGFSAGFSSLLLKERESPYY